MNGSSASGPLTPLHEQITDPLEYWRARYARWPEYSGKGSEGLPVESKAGFVARHAGDYAATVLDYGCGNGNVSNALLVRRPELHITRYDFAIPGRDTMPTGTFDVVMALEVLEHVPAGERWKLVQRLWKFTRSRLFVTCAVGEYEELNAQYDPTTGPLNDALALPVSGTAHVVAVDLFGVHARSLIFCLERV